MSAAACRAMDHSRGAALQGHNLEIVSLEVDGARADCECFGHAAPGTVMVRTAALLPALATTVKLWAVPVTEYTFCRISGQARAAGLAGSPARAALRTRGGPRVWSLLRE